jgi:alpha-galactosidase
MRALGDKAHKEGMKFILWFEPERVHAGTQLDREIPEFLIHLPGSEDRLVKLGDPKARRFLTDLISDKIKAWGVDLYRQDFNIDPLPFWQSQDSAERIGITEMKYVEGLYEFWDELRWRFPGLTIDNTASGGRRIDLETISRSYPLWRSDFNDIGEGLKGEHYWPQMGMAHQIHSSGLSLYFPYHSGPLWSMQPYNVRSAMTSNIVLYDDILRPGFPDELARQAITEVKSLRPYVLGDYYVLLPFSEDQGDWFAWQYHRPKEGDGFAVFFRRAASAYIEAEVPLRAID